MSTAVRTAARSQDTSASDQLIDQRLEEARRALWWSELIRTSLTVVIGVMLAILMWLVVDHWIYSPGPLVRTLCLLSLVLIACYYFLVHAWPVFTSRVTTEYAAWALENDHPDYRQQLTSYVTLKSDDSLRGVRARVVRAIGSRAASLLKTHDSLPGEATGTFWWWIVSAAVLATLVAYCVSTPKSPVASAKRLFAPLASIEPAKRVSIFDVQPGDAKALAGRDVTVSAEIMGLREGEPVLCRWLDNRSSNQIEMQTDRQTDRFWGTVSLAHSASGNIRYFIEAGDATAGPFELNVQNVPVVAVDSVRYSPPAYTGQVARTSSSPSIVAIDGTRIEIAAKVNRPIAKAELQFNPKQVAGTVQATGGRLLIPISEDGVSLKADLLLRSASGRAAAVELESYRIRVWDASDQPNPNPIVYPIKIIADLPPDVTIVVPQKSPIRVPINGQQTIEVHAMDPDFELEEVSLRLQRGIDRLDDPVIWKRTEHQSGTGNKVSEYRFRPTDFRLRIGDVVKITATAVDNRVLPSDANSTRNSSTTDPVEIQIVQAQQNLPDDPTEQDGLTRPDDRPASDVQSGSGASKDQNATDQNATDQNAGRQESGRQESGSAGGKGQQAGSQSSQEQGEGGSPSGSGGQNNEPADSQSTSSAGNHDGETSPNTPDSDTQDSTGQHSSSPQNGTSGSTEDSPSSTPQDRDMPDDGQADPSNESSDQTNQPGGHQDSTETSSQGDRTEGQPPSSQQDPPPQTQPNDQSGQAPEHDGQAFERIKDYIEKQRNQGSQSGSESSNNQSGQRDDSNSKQASENAGTEQSDKGTQQGDKGTEQGDKGTQQSDKGTQQSDKGTQQSDKGTQQSDKGTQQSDKGTQQSDKGTQQSDKGTQQSDKGTEQSDKGTEQGDKGTEQGDKGTEQSDKGTEQSDKGTQQGDKGTEQSDKGTEQGQLSDHQSQSDHGAEENSATSDSKPSQSSHAEDQDPSQPSNKRQDQRDPTENEQTGNQQPGTQSDSAGRSGDPGAADSDPGSQDNAPQQDHREGTDTSNANSSGTGRQNGRTGNTPPTNSQELQPPPPPDLEYTKKATDMVLDYLDETKDQVDQDLLKELDWTEQDLQRFRQRWEKVRQLDQPGGRDNKNADFEDALKSLGLQNTKPARTIRRDADSIRNLRDSGNRRKPPASIREAFEAFRRGTK